jgi:peptidoglycan hydrolase-like protein with peptidoglycan-binding domain
VTRAAAVVAAALAIALTGCGGDVGTDAGSTTSTTRTTIVTTTTTSTTTTSTTVPTTTTTAAPALEGLAVGATGPAVQELESRLDALGYWPGGVDATFDRSAEHAVVALQKVAGLGRTGTVDAATAGALLAGVAPVVQSTTGRVVEIDLAHQVLTVATDGRVTAVFDTSTGRRAGTTPTGRFHITREIDGPHRSPLGLLYRPKYFVGGVAIHGYTSVPPTPASHGCVRVTYPAMDHLWATGMIPIGTDVWVL